MGKKKSGTSTKPNNSGKPNEDEEEENTSTESEEGEQTDEEEPGSENEGEGDKESSEDDSELSDKAKAIIAKLRKENAKHRTKNKELASKASTGDERTKAILKAAGIQIEDEDPEELVKGLSAENHTMAFSNAVLRNAVVHGIAGDDLEYFEFLVAKAQGDLEDGDELDADAIAEIAAKAKKSGKGSANTSVGAGKGGSGNPNPKPGESKEITLDKFCRMTITEKSMLYEKSPEQYKALASEAKAKKRLI